jgi:hypothetical protein
MLINTDTFNDPIEAPYLWPKQGLYFAGSQVGIEGQIYLPLIYK